MLIVGEKVGGWRVEQELGSGAVGPVYLGRAVGGEARALLRLVEDAEPLVRRGLEKEQLKQRGVRHDGLAVMLELVQHRGGLVAVCQDARGPTLGAWLATDPPKKARRAVFGDLLSAVAAAHRRGLLHGDLGPDTVVMVGDGERLRPVIVGFGLDRHVLGAANPPRSSSAWRAPEVLHGLHRTTRASDVFSLGALLYQLEVGRPPFGAAPPEDGEVRAFTPPLDIVCELEHARAAAIMAALEPDPERRLPDCEALAAVLEGAGGGRGEGEREDEETDALRRRTAAGPSMTPFVLGGVVAGIAAALAVVLTMGVPGTQPPEGQASDEQVFALAAATAGVEEAVEVSGAPAGPVVALAAASPAPRRAFVNIFKDDVRHRVCLQGGARCYGDGPLPAGAYPVWVETGRGVGFAAGEVVLAPGERARLRCDVDARRCDKL